MMTWLATVSYGFYLWHVPVLQAVSARLAPSLVASHEPAPLTALWLFALVAVIAAGLGAASWYLVEQPSRQLLSRRPGKGLAQWAAAKTV
jgi:peptidoglycan/LPS O-acetylase OafA/YrhL